MQSFGNKQRDDTVKGNQIFSPFQFLKGHNNPEESQLTSDVIFKDGSPTGCMLTATSCQWKGSKY